MWNSSEIPSKMSTCQYQQFEKDLIELRPALFAFARKFSLSHDVVEDLVQDTLLKALRHSDRFQSGTSLKSWLFTIMRNHFFTEFKLRKREPVTAFENLERLLPSPAAQEWRVYQAEVALAVERLPSEQRSALINITAGESYETTAKSLGCEIGTIKSRVSRARHRLAAQFSDLFDQGHHSINPEI